jgi:MinD-like ATPase involved in chromosome partitioning or flagellar assembly
MITTAEALHQDIATSFARAMVWMPAWEPGGQLPTNEQLGLIRRRPAPHRGWRKLIHRASLGAINPGESQRDISLKAQVDRVKQPVRGDYSIAVLSMKGGVGKTTVTVGLGATFASQRGDRVIAFDANPDFGTLAQRGPIETRSTVRDLLFDNNISRYSDIRQHTSQASSRLEILASERDPAVSDGFSEVDYRGALSILRRFYNIVLTDCGTGLVHSTMAGILGEADALVIVTAPAMDAARSGLATLDWLRHHGYSHLVSEAVIVVNCARPGAMPVDIGKFASNVLPHVRAVHSIPFDRHLAEGSEISLDLLSRKTRQAFMGLAATIADAFGEGENRPAGRPNLDASDIRQRLPWGP